MQILFSIVGVGVLFWTVYSCGTQNYIDVFLHMSPGLFVLALILPVLEEISASLQLHKVYQSTGIPLKLWDMFWINQWGSFLGDLQKGVGVAVAIDSISLKTKTSHVDVAGRYSLYYAVVMIVRALATAVGFVYFLRIVPVEYQSVVVFFIGLVCFASAMLLLAVFGTAETKVMLIKIFGCIPILGRIAKSMTDIRVTESLGVVLYMFVFAMLNWLFASLHWFVVSYCIGYPIDFRFCMAGISLLSLPKLVPFLPASIGVYDVVVMAGLSVVNVPAFAGLSFAMIERLTDIASNSIAVLKPEYLRFFNNVVNINVQ